MRTLVVEPGWRTGADRLRSPARRLAGLVAAIALSGCVTAGPGLVRGVVSDSATGGPLPGVMIMLDSGQRTHTDNDGRFVMRGIAPGEHHLLVLGRGCRASSASVDVAADRPTQIAFRASFGASGPPESGTEPPESSGGRVVTAADIEGMQAASIVDVIRRVAPYMVGRPASQAGGSSRLRGRGGRTMADARIPVLVVDDVVLYAQDSSLLDAIPVQEVAWIQIVPGAIGGWQFGTGGSGGVIRVRTHGGNGIPEALDPADCLAT